MDKKITMTSSLLKSSKIPEMNKNAFVKDIFSSCIRELFFIRNPKCRKNNFLESEFCSFEKNLKVKKKYIYYPWNNVILILPEEKVFLEILTARNKGLITASEQKKFRNCNIAIVGLSIGSAATHFIARSGGAKRFKLADFDSIEVSNLNRMNAGLLEIGENKSTVAAKKIWEINPYSEIQIWDKGINENNMQKFLTKDFKADFVIDAIDDLPLKVILRKKCKRLKIPVVMATSNGDSIIVDVERYDTVPQCKIFHGRISENPENYKFKTYKEWLVLANKIIDKKLISKELIHIMPKIGISFAGVPQLATTVNYGGLIISNIIRDIARGKNIDSGRYIYQQNKEKCQ